MNQPLLAAIPAFALVFVSLVLFLATTRQAGEGRHTHFVVGVMFLALATNAFVAGLAIIGVINDQNTITFWSAVARSIAIICGSYVAWNWWKGRD